jgi:hypothetical protein
MSWDLGAVESNGKCPKSPTAPCEKNFRGLYIVILSNNLITK